MPLDADDAVLTMENLLGVAGGVAEESYACCSAAVLASNSAMASANSDELGACSHN